MFKDLKEYQEITQLYYDSVNISEEQRQINKIFIEEGFTLEEIEYLEENFDKLWENELSQFTEQCLIETYDGQNLTEEQIQQIDEVLGLKLLAKGITKAAPKISKGLRVANVGIKKGLKSAKTAVKDTARGAMSVGKSALKKVGGAIKKAAPFALKAALPFGVGAALVGGVSALRNKGKKEREAENKKNETKITPPPQIGGGNAGGSTDSGGTAGGDKGGSKPETKMPDPPKQPEPPKATETEKPKKKMSSIEKKNRARFGDAHVDKLKNKQKDFKKMKKGEMTKADFIKAYPKSITAQTAAGLRDHTEWDAYDKVLEYLFSTDQVDTIEEANYIMMEMDQETIGSIVYEVDEFLEEGFIDNLKAGVSKVKKVAGDVKDTAVKTTKKVVSKGKEILSSKNKVKTLNPLSKENKKIRDKKASMTDDNKGKVTSQISAIKRQRDGKTIADVQAANKEKMRAAAKARNEKFKKDRMKK